MSELTGPHTTAGHLQLVTRPAERRAESTEPYARRKLQNILILAVSDALALLLAVLIGICVDWMIREWAFVPRWILWLPAVWVVGAYVSNQYPGWGVGRIEALRQTFRLAGAVFTLGAVMMVPSGDPWALTYGVTCAAAAVLVPISRSVSRRRLLQAGTWGVPVVIYGAGECGDRALRLLRRERRLGLHPAAMVDDNPAYQGRIVAGFKVLGRPGDRIPGADVAVLAMPPSARRARLLHRLTGRYRKVIVLGEETGGASVPGQPRDFDGIMGTEFAPNLVRPSSRLLKRTAELLLLWVAAPLWLPLLTFTALLIWLEDRHTPFTRQVRVGRGGIPFTTLRFRTVVPHTGETLRSSLCEDPALRLEWNTRFRLACDPRVTRLGRHLRRLGLDGLPQLLNVMRGQMALVGPRLMPPHGHAKRSEFGQRMLHFAAPGMTGLWKIYGDREDEWSDLYYVCQWSATLDGAVLLQSWIDAVTSPGGSRPRPYVRTLPAG